MRKSLSVKMLIMTFGSFLILIFGIVATLYIYFDRFYEPLKINHTIQAINEFTASFEENNWNEDQLYEEVYKFMKSQNVTMSIKPRFIDLYPTDAGITITRNFPIPNYYILNNQPLFQFSYDPNITTKLRKRAYATAFGFNAKESAGSMYGVSLSANINGKVVVYSGAPTAFTKSRDNVEEYQKDGVSYTISTIPYTNYRQVDFMKQCTLSDGEIQFTNVTLSLQSVNEVTDFLLGIFPFLIAAAVLLSVIMVIVYSRTISKPIISLTKTANQMANMDFGITSNIKRQDELGVLSASLNTLSGNLKNALEDLSQANTQLKEDYENELRQEKARKEFVANVSHELKTPLGIIKSYTEGIRDGVKAEKKDHYMEVILDEISRMDQMIKEMLEISKFDAGAVKYNKQPVEFDNILEKSVNFFTEKAGGKGVIFKISGEYGTCSIDEDKIQRVLNNLIENAVKYCNSNSLITIRGEKSDDLLTVRIENDCLAFSEEVLAKIWDRFYKADTSHNRDMEGTGLGLSIAKSILEGHGCRYGVYNTDNGVCFYFTLTCE